MDNQIHKVMTCVFIAQYSSRKINEKNHSTVWKLSLAR